MVFVLLFFIGLVAGFMNVMAGGGSTLTLPMLIFTGLDGAEANGTNRLALLIQNIFAVWGFRQEGHSKIKKSFQYAIFTLPGAILGALVAVKIPDLLFKRILAVVIILVIISMLLPKIKENVKISQNKFLSTYGLYFALFGVGFYGGFIQAGVGFIIMATFFYFAGLNLVQVNMHKVFVVLIYTIPALAIFAFSGNIDWVRGIVLAAGNGLGGWLSARLSVKKGDRLVRGVLIFALLIMSIKLIFTQ